MAVRNTLRMSQGVRILFDPSERGYSVRTGCTYVRVRTMFVQSEHIYSVRTGCTSRGVRTLFDQSERGVLAY